jgi:hypothetical protein
VPALHETQRAFAGGLIDGVLPQNVTARIPEEAPLRFAVYRNNVRVGLIEALRARFPVVERLVGEEFFRACAGLFATRHPPRSRLLMQYGEDFPAFLESFEPARSLPYLPDVARLEIARGEAYHAADAEPLGPEAFARAASGDVERLRLRLHPSLRLVVSRYPIVAIWEMNQPGRKPERLPLDQGETALVARPAMTVNVEPISPGYAAFLAAFAVGGDLSEAASAAASREDDFDLAGHLARIFASGLVTDINQGS